MPCSISCSLDLDWLESQVEKTNQYIKKSRTSLWQTTCTEIVSKLRGTQAQQNLVPGSDI